MKNHVQSALVIAAILYLGWGLSLLVAPEQMQALLSSGTYDPTTTAMFGASLFAFVLVFLIAAHNPTQETVHASVSGLLFIGFVGLYQMFVAKGMPQTTLTVLSMVINLAVAIYLLITLTDAAMVVGGGKRGKAKPKARRRR
ncbi:MAG: hypothetical protein AAB252_02400 [Pseudomonadota bacterium]